MTVRVGFVGVGGRAVTEMADLVRLPNVEIVALCDVSLERCQAGVRKVVAALGAEKAPTRATQFTSVAEMLRQADPDAVYVSLPPFAHGEVERQIVGAGKAICVEKPVALDMATAREIQAIVEGSGVVSAVGYQLRYGTTVTRAKQILEGRTIGLVAAVRLATLPDSPWWRVQAKSGGMLVEQHTHGIDLMRYLVGEVESVYAIADTRLLKEVPDLSIHDVNSATLRFANGAVGCILNSCAVPHSGLVPLGNGIHIVAKDVTISLDFAKLTAVYADGRVEVLAEDPDTNYRLNSAFIGAVESGDRSQILSDYTDGVRTFEVTYATLLAAQRGQVVRLGVGY